MRCGLALMEFACSEETVVCRQFDPKDYSFFSSEFVPSVIVLMRCCGAGEPFWLASGGSRITSIYGE